MDLKKFQYILDASSSDGHFSRKEKQELVSFLELDPPSTQEKFVFRDVVFAQARQMAEKHDLDQAFSWAQDVLNTVDKPQDSILPHVEAHFSPGNACLDRIIELIRHSTQTIDICVNTITHNPIAHAIADAHLDCGVDVRIIAETDKVEDEGADVGWLRNQGVEVLLDEKPGLMHHKFALFDNQWLVNGSFNWTRSATEDNYENVVVTNDCRLIEAFSNQFEILWEKFQKQKGRGA